MVGELLSGIALKQLLRCFVPFKEVGSSWALHREVSAPDFGPHSEALRSTDYGHYYLWRNCKTDGWPGPLTLAFHFQQLTWHRFLACRIRLALFQLRRIASPPVYKPCVVPCALYHGVGNKRYQSRSLLWNNRCRPCEVRGILNLWIWKYGKSTVDGMTWGLCFADEGRVECGSFV